MKIFWLFNHPAPYKVDFFNELGKHCELTAMFERDQEGGRNAEFYSHKAKNFREIRCHAHPIGAINSCSFAPVKHLKKNHYDVVVLNGYRTFTEMKTISYCRRHKIPYVFYINGGIKKVKENPLQRAIKRKYISRASSYLCPDENSAEYLTYYGAEPSLISIYPYSSVYEKELVASPLSLEEKLAIRKEFGIEGKHVYASSGFFIPRKNFGQLISLWPHMPKEDTLVIIGEGPLQEKFEAQIKELGLTNVKLLPFMSHDKELRFFSCADAFLFLSQEDIYGHVIEEALSQALPIVSDAQVNAAVHLVHVNENGYLVPLDEQEKILKSFIDVLNPDFPKRCLEIAKENTIESSVKYHLSYFASYLEKVKQ